MPFKCKHSKHKSVLNKKNVKKKSEHFIYWKFSILKVGPILYVPAPFWSIASLEFLASTFGTSDQAFDSVPKWNKIIY